MSLMWKSLAQPWQLAFEMAWQAYKNGTIPIGAVVVNEDDEIISVGRNRIFDEAGSSALAGTNMAHAEMDALIGLTAKEHPNIHRYKLYTTMEPCPMCFGASVMMNIRNIHFAARDGFAGATLLNDKLDYIKNKKLNIVHESGDLEVFQLILQTSYEFGRKHPRIDEIMNSWKAVNETAVNLGEELQRKQYFEKAAVGQKQISEIYNELMTIYTF